MNPDLPIRCADINSLYCPCILSELNGCVHCSRLRGEDKCECNWSGMCIYYEKYWREKTNTIAFRKRETTVVNYEIKEIISSSVYKISIPVPPSLAVELGKTGAFVFLRSCEDPDDFFFPVGIMRCDDEHIEVVVDVIGPKTRRLFMNSQKLCIKGPYYNGILGYPWIDEVSYGKIIVVAGGMGQPPSVPIVQKLLRNHNNVMAVLAPGKTGIFVQQELEQLGCEVYPVCSMRQVGIALIKKWLTTDAKPDLIVSAGPDEQHYGIIDAMKSSDVNIPMATTNNATMCCGDGICGACKKKLTDGRLMPLCKLQTSFNQLKDYI